MIRIAVGTSDMQVVCDHLARSSAFVVMEIEEGKITSRTVRDRGTDACGNHKSFVELLRGCDAVLCGGIGQGAFDSLKANRIAPLVIAGQQHSIDDTVALYIAGKLQTTDERICLCG